MQQKLPFTFLALSLLFTGLLFFMPMATFSLDNHTCQYYATKIMLLGQEGGRVIENWYSMGLTVLILGISAASLIFFKKSFLSLRLCMVNIILLLGLILITILQISNYSSNLGIENTWEMAACFPIISIIWIWMATRYVFKQVVQEKLNMLKKATK